MRDLWKPWSPEIGQRVRVLNRPECFYCREDHDLEVGQTGVVTHFASPCMDEPGASAHDIWIRFDDPTIAERTVARTGISHFAATELEPVP